MFTAAKPGGKALQRVSNLIELNGLFRLQGDHKDAPVGNVFQKAFLYEPVNCFPHRRTRSPNLLGDHLHIYPGTGVEAVICDHLFQNVVNLVTEPLLAYFCRCDHNYNFTPGTKSLSRDFMQYISYFMKYIAIVFSSQAACKVPD